MNEKGDSHIAITPRIVYCRCAYARIVPQGVKDAVLEALASSGADFDAVPDLCEMSARKDPRLEQLASDDEVKIIACYPRAVRWLFKGAGVDLDRDKVRILNMREEPAEAIVSEILPAEVSA
jgi:hypothetical protein